MKKIIKAVFLSLIALIFIFFTLDFLFPLDSKKLYPLKSSIIYDKDNKPIRFFLSKDGFWRFDSRADEIPDMLKKSVLLFEDKYFYYHFGINPFSIFRAFFNNIFQKRQIGASTITMQVARMMYKRERTYLNKIKEMFNALQLELRYTKDEILNFYFNLAPYGGNIEGVKAASYFYFKNNLKDLTIAQIALLSIIPKNPNKNRIDKVNTKIKNKILQILLDEKVIDKATLVRAKKEKTKNIRFHSPNFAPHFTNLIKDDINETYHSRIDLNLQLYLTNILNKKVRQISYLGISNAAGIVIDNKNMQVISYIGSDDFYSKLGQNDAIKMVKSPGSTLKPFVYAKALDLGIITPNKELFDVPVNYGSYTPTNFNKHFFGSISTSESLEYSLNIPAIMLNNILGENSLYEMLKLAQIKSLYHDKEFYGQGIVLGGFDINLLDIAHLYTAFANDGKLLKLQVGTKSIDKNVTLFSKQAAFLINEILANSNRLQFSSSWEFNKNLPKVAFKTGTSANSKDLYTVGYTKNFTIGVWFGNFNSTSSNNLSGLRVASEIVLDTFRFMQKKYNLNWFQKPKGIKKHYICLDGIKSDNCYKKGYDLLIDNVNLKNNCNFLQPEVFLYLISEKRINKMSDLASNPCFLQWLEYKPILASPIDKGEYFIENKSKIMLKCYSYKSDGKVFLQIDNNEFFAAKSSEEIFLSFEQGIHEIKCLDSYSNTSISTFEVKNKEVKNKKE